MCQTELLSIYEMCLIQQQGKERLRILTGGARRNWESGASAGH